MFFSNAFAHRCWVDFLRLRTLKIELSPRREHDFRKIDVFKKGSKKHRFWLYFWKPNRRKFDKKSIRKMCFFSTLIFMRFLTILLPFWGPKIIQKSLIFGKHRGSKASSKALWLWSCFLDGFGSPQSSIFIDFGSSSVFAEAFPSI